MSYFFYKMEVVVHSAEQRLLII